MFLIHILIHIDFKTKPSEASNAKVNSLWKLLCKMDFIVPFMWERCHPYSKLVKALSPLTKAETQNLQNS